MTPRITLPNLLNRSGRDAKSRKVFLCGPPRCRSGWFANLLTCGDSFIYHDGFDGCETFDDFKAKLNIPYRVVGNSDPANVFFWKQIVTEWPDATWIVIKRDTQSVVDSIDRLIPGGIDIESIENYEHRIEHMTDHVHAEIFTFETLDKDDCRHIAKLCDVPLDERRLEMLWKLNVQIDPKYLRRRIGEIVANPPQLMKKAVYA